jgi:hypothetical protein
MNADVWTVLGRIFLAIPLLLVGCVAVAEKPEWAGRPGEQGRQRDRDEGREERRDESRGNYSSRKEQYEREDRDERRGREGRREGDGRYPMEPRIGVYFGESHRAVIREHYSEQGRAGFCPPGLAKKNNGCQPPGQARAWAVGRPLPRDVAYYPLEPSVQVRLGRPPAGYEFVRVASDILLIAVGTSMVMDAIQDLGR